MKEMLANTAIERKEPAVIIDLPQRFVQASFRPVVAGLSRRRFHQWVLVLEILLNLRRAKLMHLARVLPSHGHRTTPVVLACSPKPDQVGMRVKPPLTRTPFLVQLQGEFLRFMLS